MSSSKKSSSRPVKEVRQYITGDPVLGKMRGYPPWPGIVVDPADAPPAVQQQQPPNKKANAYCILFFPMGDYGWLNPKELSFLQRHEIEAFLADDAKKRNGELREGYRIALNPQPWLSARIAAEAAQQDAEDNAQVDQLAPSDEDDEDGTAAAGGATSPEADDDDDGKPKRSRKRKRESESSAKKEKAAAKPKTKKGSAEPKAAKKPAKPRKSTGGAKSKAMIESEDEGAAAAGLDEPLSAAPITAKGATSPPPTKKARRDAKEDEEDAKNPGDPQSHKVRDWRHKLQKTFLSSKSPPKPEVMAEFDALFTTVEQYDEMTIEQLQFSKIGKVMRHIAALQGDKVPPRDSDYSFRLRAKGLVDKWQRILNANRPAGNGASPGEPKEDGVAGKAGKNVDEKVNGSGKKSEVTAVEEAVAGVDLNGAGADSPIPTIAAPIPAIPTASKPTSTTADADAQGEHDQDANAEAEDASMHVEDVVMADA